MVFVQCFHKTFKTKPRNPPQSLSPRLSLIPDTNRLLSPSIFTAKGLETAKLTACAAYHEVIRAWPRGLLLLWSGGRQLLWLSIACLAPGARGELCCPVNPCVLQTNGDS